MTRAQTVRDRIVDEVAASGFGAHGLHVLVGDDTAAHRWAPDVREDIHSAAKGICVIAAGIAADEGMLSFDEPIADAFPGVALGDGVDQITLRQLLSMSSGIDLPWSETMMTDWPDLAVEFLGRPSRGRVFQYSSASTYVAMRVLADRVGDVVDYLAPRLFDPLGISDVVWARCPNGYIEAGGGLALRTDELARIGRLIRDRGRWQGEQLVSAGWVDAMSSDWVVAGENPDYDRYALAGWGGPGSAWRLHGAYGQMLIFSGDAVVTVTAADHLGADALAASVVETLDS
ncbi:CubicO group peptidase (beta-lactamase class C family) [Microbacterium terrae]|uniref:6-aminohexanoate-dimer hydrolase n=1 Tax=Microbacterium terrae TaxID=69369 RepID=A0A0M2HBF1_9MICO|nr:serine hydrolase [Microbacterium terrae]KJL43938.1 6-aminohexanoate-dimer hydrolase [Microbacterium terrae]MBP1078653.1 CubicO group peptidase (beta-lactamase class C family) [Microbacterium terrae]GLJ98055.1 penicillin-binding protein [Microbacterium terrae]